MKRENTNTASVVLNGDIINIVVIGNVNEKVVLSVYRRTKTLIKRLRASNRPAHILVDLTRTGKEDSGARVVAKKFLQMEYDRVAIFGASPQLSRTVLYLIRSVGRFANARYFKRESEARRWLKSGEMPFRANRFIQKVGTVMIMAGGLFLAGWLIDNVFLTRLYRDYLAVDPLTAVSFVALGCVLLLLAPRLRRPIHMHTMRMILGAIIALNLLILLRYAVRILLGNDAFLWSDSGAVFGRSLGIMAPATAAVFVLVSSALLLAEDTTNRQRRILAQVFLSVVIATTVLVLIGYAYGLLPSPHPDNFVAMALGTALLLTVTEIAIVSIYADWSFSKAVRNIQRGLWISLAVFMLAQSLTGILWQQTANQVKQTSQQKFDEEFDKIARNIDQRLSTYIDTLYGYRALYVASTEVTRQDFQAYYESLDPLEHYPGIYAFSFIRYVRADDVSGFLADIRQDQSLPDYDPSKFTIRPQVPKSDYYVVTFASPAEKNLDSLGFDLGSDTDRRFALEQAQALGTPVATGTINIETPKSTGEQRRGFLMTMPLYKGSAETVEERRANSFGFVNAIFEYTNVFSGVLRNGVTDGLSINLYDPVDDQHVYQESGSMNTPIASAQTKSGEITAAGRSWKLEVFADPSFGVSSQQASVPSLVLFSGSIVSVLLGTIVALLSRSRQQALDLAGRMTEDLRRERNIAVEIQRKDEAILTSIGEGVLAVDTKGRIVLFNSAAALLTGYNEDEVINKPHQRLLWFGSEKTRKRDTRFVQQALSGSTSRVRSHILRQKDGTVVSVSDTAAPIRNAEGIIIGAIIIFRDATQERELERAQDEFVSLASHELRTPATAVKNFVGLLRDGYAGQLSSKQSEFVDMAYESNERELQLIDDLLFIARSEEGRVELDVEPVDMVDLIEGVITEQEFTIQTRRQSLVVDISAKKLIHTVDRHYMHMVIANLLSNASKYTGTDGTITVHAERTRNSTIINITDTGVGIAAKDIGKLFKKFSRLDNALSVQAGGAGLGLYLAYRIVELHNGLLHVDSVLHKGSTFTVELFDGRKGSNNGKRLQ